MKQHRGVPGGCHRRRNAAYPGVIVGVVLAAGFTYHGRLESVGILVIMGCAGVSCLLGTWMIRFLEHRLNVKSDAALCFVLSAFFGLGMTLASQVQFSHTGLYKQSLSYLYGQAATMTDVYIVVYGVLAGLILAMVLLLYKEILAYTFDHAYASTIGIRTTLLENILFFLVVLAVVIGIRSVGVVLMSAMLIAPACAARQYTHRLSVMLALASIFGLLSGFLGNYFSVEGSHYLMEQFPDTRIALPTGPMIVIVATAICLFSLLLAPERGVVLQYLRAKRFQYQCVCENILKAIWRVSPNQEVPYQDIARYQSLSPLYLRWVLNRLEWQGWVQKTEPGSYRLTVDGEQRAAKIVRLHRLWEVYLVDYLGVGSERVHRSAEQMEHIITPKLERELTLLLDDPKQDPHQQPIPPMRGTLI